MRFYSALLPLSLLSCISTSSPIEPRTTGPTCTTFSFPVSVSAKNARLPSGLTTSNILSVLGAVGLLVFDSLVTDTFSISATYCEPEVVVQGRGNKLQLLVHGITYTKTYWSGEGFGEQYSWVSTASKAGFPTLAIDRLGSGNSTHADPILVVQYPTEVETIYATIVLARAGLLPSPASRIFRKIIYIGHSYGSIIGNALTTKYPSAVDGIILTGWSSTFVSLIPTVFGEAVVVPAQLADPVRFGALPLGYLTIGSAAGAKDLFWAGGYNVTVMAADFASRGTLTAGEAATLPFGVTTSSGYTGSVMVVTGEHDSIFCDVLGLNFLLGQSQCGDNSTGYLARSRVLYPSARVFDTLSVEGSGHCWQLHYAALGAFGEVHQWLARQSF